MARPDIPHCKFHFFPRWSLWSGGRGGLPPPPPLLWCTVIRILPCHPPPKSHPESSKRMPLPLRRLNSRGPFPSRRRIQPPRLCGGLIRPTSQGHVHNGQASAVLGHTFGNLLLAGGPHGHGLHPMDRHALDHPFIVAAVLGGATRAAGAVHFFGAQVAFCRGEWAHQRITVGVAQAMQWMCMGGVSILPSDR